MMQKKLLATLLAISMCVSLLASCGTKPNTPASAPQSKPSSQSQPSKEKEPEAAKSTTLVIDKAGTFKAENGVKEVVIDAADVVLENSTVDKVTISAKVGEGDVTLQKVNAKTLNVNGGGKNTVKLIECKFTDIKAARADGTVHISLDSKSSSQTFSVSNAAILDMAGTVNTLNIAAEAKGTVIDVQKGSRVSNIVANASSEIKINEKLANLIITNKAEGTTVAIAKDAAIDTLGTNVKMSVKGTGTIGTVITDKKENLTSEIKPGKTTISKTPVDDVTAKAEGKETEKTPAAPAKKPATPTPTPTPVPAPVPTPIPDNVKLNLSSIELTNPTTLMLTFSEAVDAATAQFITNYAVSFKDANVAVSAAAVQANAAQVKLTIASTTANRVNQMVSVTVQNLKAVNGRTLGTATATVKAPYTQVLRAFDIKKVPPTIVVPVSGKISSSKMTIYAADENLDPMEIAPVITWSIDPAVAGVSIADGIVTIDSAAFVIGPTTRQITVKGVCGSVSDDAVIAIMSTAEELEAINTVNTAASAADLIKAIFDYKEAFGIDVKYTYNILTTKEKAAVDAALFAAKPYANATAIRDKFIAECSNAIIASVVYELNNKMFLPSAQANCNTLDQARSAVKNHNITFPFVSVEIVDISFTPAVAGTKTETLGTNGSYKFKLKVSRPFGTDGTTREKELVIKATPYVISTDATLSSLTLTDLNGETMLLDPAFAASTTSYTSQTNKPSVNVVTVLAQAADANADSVTVTATGTGASVENNRIINLATTGDTTITVTVTAEDESTTKAYDVIVSKKAKSDVTNSFKTDAATVTYDGNTIDVSKLFTLDSNAGAPTYTVTGSAGAYSFNSPNLTVLMADTFTVKVDTAATAAHNAGTASGVLTVNKGTAPAAPAAVSAFGASLGQTTVSSLDAASDYDYVLGMSGVTNPTFGGPKKGNDAVFTDMQADANTHLYIRKAETDVYNAGDIQALELKVTKTITDLDLSALVKAPAINEMPVRAATSSNSQFNAVITWADTDGAALVDPTPFAASTAYTATVTITPKAGYVTTGIASNGFLHTAAGAVATNAQDAATVVIQFAQTTSAPLEDQGDLIIKAIAPVTYGVAPITVELDASGSGLGLVSYALSEVSQVGGTPIAAISGDEITFSGAGTFKITATKAAEGNFNAKTSEPITVTVNKKQLTLTDPTVAAKTYDGTTAVTVTGTLGAIENSDAVAAAMTASVPLKAVTADAQAVTVSEVTLSGAKADNYLAPDAPTGLTVKITPKALTVTGITATDMVYNADTDVAFTGGTLNGVVAGETVSISSITGTRVDKNVGNAVATTISSIVLSDATNYTITIPADVTVKVTAKDVTVSGVKANSKGYDSTNAVTFNTLNAVYTGLEGADVLSLNFAAANASFSDANAGTSKTVTLGADAALSGADAANYNLTNKRLADIVLTANITKAPLTATPTASQSFAYTGTAPTLSYTVTGAVNSEIPTFTGVLDSTTAAAAAYAAGTYTITNGTLALSGDAVNANYTLSIVDSVSFEITLATQAAPDAPAISADTPVTDTTVTLVAPTAGAGSEGELEYGKAALDDATTASWQSGLEFTGLTPETQYFFFARHKAVTGKCSISAAGASVTATTTATP